MTGHNLSSHGRGGAGNMADTSHVPPLQPEDLETPILRTPVVTTGRGGTGNMAKNVDPAETRARQDVVPVRRSSQNAAHSGRGGAGNVFKPESEEAAQAAAAFGHSAVAGEEAPHDPSQGTSQGTSQGARSSSEKKRASGEHAKSLVNKGKEWLLGKLNH